MNDATPQAELGAQDQVLEVALRLMRPYARLLIAQGLKYGEASEVLKRAFVDASRAELIKAGTAANVSRISVSTGLHRQDVKRLLDMPSNRIERGRSLASEVYTRWLTDSRYRLKGQPRVLPMRAGARQRSFEMLARSVSTDVHPRTLSEELRRLGLVETDDDGATLRISSSGFVPINERAGMLGFLADNVGDHLAVAVGNVLGDKPRLLEQAVYANGLDASGVTAVDAKVRELWRQIMESLVPLLELVIEQGKRAPVGATGSSPRNAAARKRVRIGMYMQAQPEDPDPPDAFDDN